jgi:hypothetical protein
MKKIDNFDICVTYFTGVVTDANNRVRPRADLSGDRCGNFHRTAPVRRGKRQP